LDDRIFLKALDNSKVSCQLVTIAKGFIRAQDVFDVDGNSGVNVGVLRGFASVLCPGAVPTPVNPDV
jgi:hypothetical protein